MPLHKIIYLYNVIENTPILNRDCLSKTYNEVSLLYDNYSRWHSSLINAVSITDSDAKDACQPFHLLDIDEEADAIEVL